MNSTHVTRAGSQVRLAAGIALALLGSWSAPAAATPSQPGAIALRAELHAQLPQAPKRPSGPAATHLVTTCADDGSAGTLRSAIAAAADGDSVDLSTLTCSTITLASGAIPVLLNNVYMTGPGAQKLAIDGAGADRVFVHPGGGVLGISGLTVRHGRTVRSGNKVTGGGCIASLGYVTLDHSTVTGCYAAAEGVYGGGIFAYEVIMRSSTLSGNTAFGKDPVAGTAAFGGGAYAEFVDLTDSTVSGNSARHDFEYRMYSYDTGGGIFTNIGGSVLRSTIDSNYSYGRGGGLSSFLGIDMVDSTVSGNVARTSVGGGLDLRLFYGANIFNSTIANNEARRGGGLYLRLTFRQALNLQSTIIANNQGSANVPDVDADAPPTITGANDLVLHAGSGVTLPPGTLQLDPLLQPLANHGGPTRTQALTPGSPALDAGNNLAQLATDQRGAGFARVVGAGPDIGAFEGALAPVVPVAVPALSDGFLALLAGLVAALGIRTRRHQRPARQRIFT